MQTDAQIKEKIKVVLRYRSLDTILANKFIRKIGKSISKIRPLEK